MLFQLLSGAETLRPPSYIRRTPSQPLLEKGEVQNAHVGSGPVCRGPWRLDDSTGLAGCIFPYIRPAGQQALPEVHNELKALSVC